MSREGGLLSLPPCRRTISLAISVFSLVKRSLRSNVTQQSRQISRRLRKRRHEDKIAVSKWRKRGPILGAEDGGDPRRERPGETACRALGDSIGAQIIQKFPSLIERLTGVREEKIMISVHVESNKVEGAGTGID